MLFMNYQTFLKIVADFVTAALPSGYFVTVYPIHKNNNFIWDAFVMKGGTISPTVYVKPYYKRYKSGEDLYQIQMEITAIFQNMCIGKKEQIEHLLSYDYAKNKIAMRLIGYETNRKQLMTVPHRRFFDMAIVYYISISYSENEYGSIQITNTIQQMWGKTEAQLYSIALPNTLKLFPPVALTFGDMLKQLQTADKEQEFSLAECMRMENAAYQHMYVVSNKANFYGGVYMYYPHIWDAIAKKADADLIITPLSVHEAVAVPFCKQLDQLEFYQEAARHTYDTIPTPTERLTPSIYYFSREKKAFSMIE